MKNNALIIFLIFTLPIVSCEKSNGSSVNEALQTVKNEKELSEDFYNLHEVTNLKGFYEEYTLTGIKISGTLKISPEDYLLIYADEQGKEYIVYIYFADNVRLDNIEIAKTEPNFDVKIKSLLNSMIYCEGDLALNAEDLKYDLPFGVYNVFAINSALLKNP